MSTSGHEDEYDQEAAAAAQREDFAQLRSWTVWGAIKRDSVARTTGKRKKNFSRFSGQWIPESSPCILKAQAMIHTWDQPDSLRELVILGDDDTPLKFEISGGSDAPEFVLKLEYKPTKQVATIHFSAWTRTEAPQANERQVADYKSPPIQGKHTFSSHLREVEYNKSVKFPPSVAEATKEWDFTGASFPLAINWLVDEEPVGINLQPNLNLMPTESQTMFRSFYKICKEATIIKLLVRGHGGMDESWRYFSAQPCPCPPPWWRYTDRVAVNEHVIDLLPPPDPTSDLGLHLRLRDKKFEPTNPPQIVQLPKFTHYVDARHYEVFVVGSHLRQAEIQSLRYSSYYNHRYQYDLTPVPHVAPDLATTNTFLVRLTMHGRHTIGRRNVSSAGQPQWAFWPSEFSTFQDPTVLETDSGVLYRSDETGAAALPQVDSDVMIVEPFDRFLGTIISVDKKVVTMKVVRNRGVGKLVLNNRSAMFVFSNPGSAFVAVQKAIQKAMTYIGHSWLRDLLLAHNNNLITLTAPPPVTDAWLNKFPPLNKEQAHALARATELGRELSQRITIIEGPPGTGKTGVVSKIVIHNIDVHRKFLLVAETQWAIHVCADRISEELQAYGDDLDRIFLIGRSGIEDADYSISTGDEEQEEGSFHPSDPETDFSDASRLKIVAILRQGLKERPFSLTSYINKRKTLLQTTPRAIGNQEKQILTVLKSATLAITDLNQVDSDLEDYNNAYKWFDRAFFDARQFYITHHARGIVCTAATATAKMFRYFRPVTLIIEEASQVTEALATATISRFFPGVQKIILVGDIHQNRPFTLPQLTEFAFSTETSLMERLMHSGVPITRLLTQYRMHPDIALPVSKYFYSSELTDAPSVLGRPQDKIWKRFHTLAFAKYPLRHSYFVHCPCDLIYRSKKNKSLMNPAHLQFVPVLINYLRQAGANDSQIAYLTMYRGQLSLMRWHETPEMRMMTVDQSQGREYNFVILDLVTPGGLNFPLGFSADVRRICVAASRAQIGLIILGNRYMGEVKFPGLGSKAWANIIEDHARAGAIRYQTMPDVQRLLKDLEVPGRFWEKVEPSGGKKV